MKSIKNAAFIGIYFTFLFFTIDSFAQSPDSIYNDNIKTAKLYNYGDQLSMPVISVNSNDKVELDFDDLDADVKYYYYTFQLCNSDWTPVDLNQYDYLKGFTQNRITNYHSSSVSLTNYTHYTAILPDANCMPSKSGNYILKVYLDGDTSKLAFTKRLLVVDNKTAIQGRVIQPFSPNIYQTHQRVQFTVGVKGVDVFSAGQQVKVVILQNFRWDNAQRDFPPTFIRGSSLEYNSESVGVFPGGKEWRWVDLTDFHLQSDRVLTASYNRNSTDIFLKPDGPRSGRPYVNYHDYNGRYLYTNARGVNPYVEADYGTVYFSFVPPGGTSYADKDIYLFGQLTNYNLVDSIKMVFNPEKGVYQTHLLLKEGFYDYTYLAVDKNNPAIHSELDGNYFETENLYTILVYFRSFTDRSDELIGVSTFDSRTDQQGVNY